MINKISVLGCGWLGLPLAKSLVADRFFVNGSTTSPEKISILRKAEIDPFTINLSATTVQGEIKKFLEKSELLIIDIPPKLKGDNKDSFIAKIQILIPFIEEAGIKKVIFVSSTSVYSDENPIITETTIPKPATESGKQLWEAEKLLQRNPHFKTTVIRFGGLLGEDRHPIRFLAGKTEIENPDAPINLIHQTDCIGIIKKIIELNCFGEIFNAVSPYHPSRKKYYTQKALELQLPLPEFNHSNHSIGKTITSNKLETILGYSFQNKML